jgi:hypothetical protein
MSKISQPIARSCSRAIDPVIEALIGTVSARAVGGEILFQILLVALAVVIAVLPLP